MTTVELAFVVLVFLTIILGLLETAFGIFEYQVVSQAARHGARLAIVRGELAPPADADSGWGGPWDPSELGDPYEVKADADEDVAIAMRKYLTGVDLSRTTIRIEWIDDVHRVDSPVRVRVTTEHQPVITFLFTSGWTLVGESTMPIAH